MTEWIITSSLLILIVLLVRRLFRGKLSLRLQYALWLVVLVRLLIPGTVAQTGLSVLNYLPRTEVEVSQSTVTAPAPEDGGGSGQAQPAQPAQAAEPVQPVTPAEPEGQGTAGQSAPAPEPFPWRTVLTAVWLAGAAAVAAALVISNLRFYLRLRRVRRAHPIPGLAVPVYVARGLPSPCLYGFPRPAVYLTSAAAGDPAVLGHVLAHELTHRRHGDHIWAVLRGAALALHWYNPLVWLSAALSKRDGELACDEGALRNADDPTRAAYGLALIRLVTTRPALTDLLCCATTMTAGKSGLKERITMIAKKPRTLLTAFAAAAFLVGLAVGCTFTGGRSDTWEPLSEEELAWFNGNEFFTNEMDSGTVMQINIRNQFLSSTYETPEDINLFALFYCGDGAANYADAPEGVDAAELEAAMLAAIGGEDPDCPATILTTAQIDAVLEEYLGLTLAETNQVGLDNFTYLPEYDIYYYFHGDTNYRGSVTFQSGEKNGDLVRLTYDDAFMGDGIKEVTLWEHGDSWQFVSNLAVEEGDSVPLESGLAALPGSLADKVVVVEPGDVTENSSGVLASYYYEPDYNTEWGGWILDVARYTPVEFEQAYYTWDQIGGASYLGRDTDWYYVCLTPTDVNFDPEHYEDYQSTGAELLTWLEGLADGAGLTPMEEDLFYQRVSMNLSYPEGEHYTVLYYPYYGMSGYEDQADTVYTLILSQPVTQGETGIWCVDRWYDDAGNKHLVIPESGQTMDEYYAGLQAACDEGHRPGLLDPMQVALEFEQAYTDRELSLDAFTLEGPTDIAETFDLYLATAEVNIDSPSAALEALFAGAETVEFWGFGNPDNGPWIETLSAEELPVLQEWISQCGWELAPEDDEPQRRADRLSAQAELPPSGCYMIQLERQLEQSGTSQMWLYWNEPYLEFQTPDGLRTWHCTENSDYRILYSRLAELWEAEAARGFPDQIYAEDWHLASSGAPVDRAFAQAVDSLTWAPAEPAQSGAEGIALSNTDEFVHVTVYPGNLVYFNYLSTGQSFWFQGTGEADLYALAAEYGA